MRIGVRRGVLRVETRLRIGVGVVLEGHRTRLHPSSAAPAEDVLGIRGVGVAHGVPDLLVAGKRLRRRVRVGEHDRVATLAMLRVVPDAEPLDEAVHEVEMRLVVLHAERDLWQVADDARGPVVGEPEPGAHRFHDLLRRLLLEDPAVGREVEEPDPRDQHETIGRDVAERAGLLGLEADAAEMPLAPGRQRHGHGDRLPEQVAEVGVDRVALEVEHTLERRAERLPIPERRDHGPFERTDALDAHATHDTAGRGQRRGHE